MIVIVKVTYKMIPHIILRFSLDGDHRKIDVNNRKSIPQTQKTMEIRVPVPVTGVKMVFKFIMSRGFGASLSERNVPLETSKSNCKQNILDVH